MYEFLIILHIVSLFVGLTFTPGIGCTTICCALRIQSYCTHYRRIWFSSPLIGDKCSISFAVLNDAGWCLLVVGAAGKIVQLRVTCSTSCVVCCTSNLWRAWWNCQTKGQLLQELLSLVFLMFPKAGHIFSANKKCVQGSPVNHSIKKPRWPTGCFPCRGVQAENLIIPVHTTFFLVVKPICIFFSGILVCLFFFRNA